MLTEGQKVIVPISEDEAILAKVTLVYKGGLYRVVPVDKRGRLRKKGSLTVYETEVTPNL